LEVLEHLFVSACDPARAGWAPLCVDYRDKQTLPLADSTSQFTTSTETVSISMRLATRQQCPSLPTPTLTLDWTGMIFFSCTSITTWWQYRRLYSVIDDRAVRYSPGKKEEGRPLTGPRFVRRRWSWLSSRKLESW
jgi:hypothetical protein